MDSLTLALLITLGIFLLPGIAILRTGLKGRREWRERVERERARTTGVVADIRMERKHVRRGPGWTSCTPVVEFRAEGRPYRLDATASTQPDEFAAGDSVDVLYDPDDPTRFHIEGRACEESGDGHLIRTGLIWIACILAIAVAFLAINPVQWRQLRRAVRDMPIFHRNETVQQEGRAEGFGYRLNDDGTATIQSYSGSDESLSIPLLLDGRVVSGIDAQAFSRSDTLKSVSVPGAMRSVPAGAFAGCLGLKDVVLNEGVASVGPLAFIMCPMLKAVTLPASLTSIGDEAFPADCDAVFRVVGGSAAEAYCAKRGYQTEIMAE